MKCFLRFLLYATYATVIGLALANNILINEFGELVQSSLVKIVRIFGIHFHEYNEGFQSFFRLFLGMLSLMGAFFLYFNKNLLNICFIIITGSVFELIISMNLIDCKSREEYIPLIKDMMLIFSIICAVFSAMNYVKDKSVNDKSDKKSTNKLVEYSTEKNKTEKLKYE